MIILLYSGMAAEAIGMPCSFHYNILNPLPSIDYVKQIQPELAANVNKLLCSLSAYVNFFTYKII